MAKTLIDYPINFPYGSSEPPYSTAHRHRGDDRAAPLGTPIVIEGITIGKVGMTGMATGYHCHIQEWIGNISNTRKPQNSFKGGLVTAATSSSDFGNYVTIQTADGWQDSYCHLSEINVKVGQIIGEDDVKITKEMEMALSYLATGAYPGKDYNYKFVGTSDVNGMITFWSTQQSKITEKMEQTLAQTATGSNYGTAYNSPYQGKPLALSPEVQKMLDFWKGQRSESGFEQVKETLYKKN